MKKDEMLPGRRVVLRLAACFGAVTVLRALSPDQAQPPGGPPSSGGPPRAAGPQAGAPVRVSSYRLQPMTAHAPPRFRPARSLVRQRPFLRLAGLGHSMVLTFDDGPDPRFTPGILSTLRHYDVRAMFFVCGEMADVHRDLLREMAEDGHVVGNHTWSHPLIPRLSRDAIRDELGRTSEVIERAVGYAPAWYRAPYGAWSRSSFEIAAELGMEPLGWSLDTLDWREPGTGTIVRRVREGAGPGVVVLSHDAGGYRAQSVAALRTYLPWLLDAGYRIAVPNPMPRM
ncbi:polysaccharide deacetylase family protein [Streptomyces spiramyceticus]|uniref:polysaccharide deacetylase family protein n=1 Tax=Streptomyces spiramyceticus TaxID=299717 RepID=UPI00237BE45F|nr:polysaccharide deacetylase family protein [Streptomyces spiramyceticus]